MQPASIMGACAVRISRLTADGTPDFSNPTGTVLLCGGINQFQHDYDKQTGADIYEEDACGNPVVVRKRPDKTKRATFSLTLARSHYIIDEILGVADAVTDAGQVVGRAITVAQGCGTGVQGNGVVIELWSEQWDCDVAADPPYMRTVLPMAFLTPKGFTRQNGVALPVYEGFSQPNANFGDGPWGDLDVLSPNENWALADVDDDTVPTCPDVFDYLAMPAGAS